MDYKLDLTINPESLEIIKAAGLKITIAKPVGGASPNVTWLVIDPFQGNTIEWKEEYGIYASPNQTISNGAVISMISQVHPVVDASYYNLMPSSNFTGPYNDASAPGKGEFKVYNQMPYSAYPALTFGLQQEASITHKGVEARPINAAIVPSQMNAVFKPVTTVYVWLQAQFQSGTVITTINGDATIVQYSGSITSKTLDFNKMTGRFVPVNQVGKQLMDDPDVIFHKRVGILG